MLNNLQRANSKSASHAHNHYSEDGKKVFTSAEEFRIRRTKALRTNGVNKPP